ncbi:MAG: tetratricopeptide repeat protein [Brevinematales bacterium]|nr:tetratricopeptide repeat protein [Brevinematales bacterium]
MNFDKLFSYLGKENTITPDRLLSSIEEAKQQAYEESSEMTQQKENQYFDSYELNLSYGETSGSKSSERTSYIESSIPEGPNESQRDEIDKFLSVFDDPLPTYETIKDLTIPDVIKQEIQSKFVKEEATQISQEVEKETYIPEQSSEPLDLLKDFKIGEVEEEKLSSEELESILGIERKEKVTSYEESLDKEEESIKTSELTWEQYEKESKDTFKPEERIEFSFEEPEKPFELGQQEESLLFSSEFGESKDLGLERFTPEDSFIEAEKIIKGFEEAEEVSSETSPPDEFFEELQRETAEPFERITEVAPEQKIYPKELVEESKEYIPKSYPVEKPTKPSELDPSKVVSILKQYPSDIRRAVKDLITNGIITEAQIEELFNFISSQPQPKDLKNYIISIAPFYRFEEQPTRRVIIAAKKSKAEEALEKVLKRSVIAVGIIGLMAIIGFVVFTTVSRMMYSENLYNRGLNLIDAGYYDEAEKLFARAEEVGGKKVEWYNTYAQRYLYNNVPERAVKKLEDALKIWPYDYKTSLNYVEALTKLPIPNFETALKYSEEFRRKEDNSFRGIDLNAQVYVKMGDYYKMKNYYKDAEILYMKYLKSKDNVHIPSLFRLISIYIRLDQKEKVDEIHDYIKKLDEKAVSEPVGVEMARYYIDKNDLSRAKKILFELSTINPKDPEYYYEFARYLFKNENYRESIKNLNTSLKLNPKHAKSYILLANIDYLVGNKNSAIENYKKAISIDPSQKEAYFKLGDIFYENKEYTTALGYYLEGLKIGEPEDVNYLSSINYNIAKIYYNNGMLNESLKYLSYSYIRDPQNPLLSQFMGNIYLELGKPDMALVQYNKSIEGYQKILEEIPALNPKIIKHRELTSFLIRTYNNQGVAYILIDSKNNVKNALLSWWEAKNYAEKINSIYPNAEYNLKLILHPTMIKYRNFSVDKEIPDSIPKYIYSYISKD